MIGRIVQGLPKAVDISELSLGQQPTEIHRRPRRTLAAFLTGAGLLALGFSSLQVGAAAGLVDNSRSPIAFILGRIQNRGIATDSGYPTPNIVWSALDPSPERKRNKAIVNAAEPAGPLSLPRRSVCVRLCDGFFFPIGPLSRQSDWRNQEAACSGLCPDAPTQLFVEPAGSDRIEDATSSNGARYTALPVAFRNRATADNTCTCHHRPGQTFSLLNDFTLRKGDSVMTATGIMVFRGAKRLPYAQNDFASLANTAMPKDKRAVLAAIERATLPSIRQSANVFLPPPRARIALDAPSLDRSTLASGNKSIHFVERSVSASN